MGDLLTTDWIEQEKQAQDVEARQSEERSLYSALTEALAKSEGLARFEMVLKEIQFQANACAKIGATVALTDVTRPADKEVKNHSFRINARSNVGWASSSYLDLSYREGDLQIRCFPRDAASFNVEFRPDRQGKLVMLSPTAELTTEADVARFILRPFVRGVIHGR